MASYHLPVMAINNHSFGMLGQRHDRQRAGLARSTLLPLPAGVTGLPVTTFQCIQAGIDGGGFPGGLIGIHGADGAVTSATWRGRHTLRRS